jgi:hypothetical protein
MKSRQPAVAAGREARDCLAVVLPVRSPARASALARTTSRSRGSGGRASCQERSRRTLGRWIRIRCTVSHLPGQPPIPGEANGGQPGPGGPALRGTIRIPAAVARHPKVPAGWNLAAGRSLTRRCYTFASSVGSQNSGDRGVVPRPGLGRGSARRQRRRCRRSRRPSRRQASWHWARLRRLGPRPGAQHARVLDAAHDGSFHSTVMPLLSAIAVKPENRHLLSPLVGLQERYEARPPWGVTQRCLPEYRCAAVSRPKVLPAPLWEGERGTPFPSTERRSCGRRR